MHPKFITFALRYSPGASMVPQVPATIFRPDLNDRLDPAHASITEFEYLASYSWLESNIPTILVPGKLFRKDACQIFRSNGQ